MKRFAYFDNAKLILIFLVVFGHMIQPFIGESKEIHTLYTWMYTFHMPAFIFLAGFFAKGAGGFDYIGKLAKKLIIPYLIFQVLYTVYYFFLGKSNWFTDTIFYPHWSLWFLFSLFCWHMLLILYKRIPPALGISIAFAVGILVGFADSVGHTFSLSRTFVFFPYFLIGFWVQKEHVMLLKQKAVKYSGLLFLAAAALIIYFLPDINTGWLLASKSYGTMGTPEFGAFARLAVYVTSILMATAVLAWMPQKEFALTKLGERTLYVYLLHGFFVQYFRERELFHVNNLFEVLGLAVLAAVIVFVLSSKWNMALWQPLIEGRAKKIRNWLDRKRTRTKNQDAHT